MAQRRGTYDSPTAQSITLEGVMRVMRGQGASSFYIKKLAPNDNSKNQIYFGSHLTDLPFIPTGEIEVSKSASSKTSDPKRRIKYQAPMRMSWIDASGQAYPAPGTKLIYYPQYPEVRFSGFLQGSKADISQWMNTEKQGRSKGRWLILGICESGKNKPHDICAYLATPRSQLSRELASACTESVFWRPEQIFKTPSPQEALLARLLEIHQMGWIPGCKIKDGQKIPYNARNAGGYTLEAMLGIAPNSIAEPDYLGWEIKQFSVSEFPAKGAKPTTLMTPEPNGGYYTNNGAVEFIKTYGYKDRTGRPDRRNFGGKHIVDEKHGLTSLTMRLNGFDANKGAITDAAGAIELVDNLGAITASWSFAKVMNHWKKKHTQAAYVPCKKCQCNGTMLFHYGSDVELGIHTNFELLLSAMAHGKVCYDPGMKLEGISKSKPKLKTRSQFRVLHRDLGELYTTYKLIDLLNQ